MVNNSYKLNSWLGLCVFLIHFSMAAMSEDKFTIEIHSVKPNKDSFEIRCWLLNISDRELNYLSPFSPLGRETLSVYFVDESGAEILVRQGFKPNTGLIHYSSLKSGSRAEIVINLKDGEWVLMNSLASPSAKRFYVEYNVPQRNDKDEGVWSGNIVTKQVDSPFQLGEVFEDRIW